MILPVNQIDDVLNGHPSPGLDGLQGNSQFLAAFRSHADCSSILVRQRSPQPWAPLGLDQNAQIFNQVHFRELLFRPRFFHPFFSRRWVRLSFYMENLATSLDRRQANDIINSFVPLGVRPPATFGVALPCGRAAHLPGCTLSRSRDLSCRSALPFRVPRHRFLGFQRPLAASCPRGRYDYRA